MLYFVLVALLASSAVTGAPYYSIDGQVGSGSGTSFTLQGMGSITGVRLWDSGNYISGIQLRYGDIWSARVGAKTNNMQELQLFDTETIVQISGKAAHYIQWMEFITNMGRALIVGQPAGQSFNMYAMHMKAELRSISGTFQSAGITGFAAQWGVNTGAYGGGVSF